MPGPTQGTIGDMRTFYGALIAVRVISTTNITLSGLQTLQGVALVEGDRVCAVGQTAGTDTGVWEVVDGPWLRALDCEVGDDIGGRLFLVEEGDNSGLYRFSNFVGLGQIGTDAIAASNVLPEDFLEDLGGPLASYHYTVTALDQSKDYISGNNRAWKSIAKMSFPGTDRIRPPLTVYFIAASSSPNKSIEIRVQDIYNNLTIATSGPKNNAVADITIATPANLPTDRAIFEIQARALESGVSYELSSVTISTTE